MPKYSQNFLTSSVIAGRIIESIKRNDFEFLVEIGPGRGFLTNRLIDAFGSKFTAVEIDPAMIKFLEKNILPENLPKIINADFLKLDLSKNLPQGKTCFAGNLPYAVGNPILQKVLDYKHFNCAVFMFQKEVADRICARTGESAYGVLSLVCQCRAQVEIVTRVKKNYFNPVPKVDSAVVGFVKRDKGIFQTDAEEEHFIKTVKSAFVHRRKTILNSLSHSLKMPKDEVTSLLTSVGVNPLLRPQNVSLEQYLALSKKMKREW